MIQENDIKKKRRDIRKRQRQQRKLKQLKQENDSKQQTAERQETLHFFIKLVGTLVGIWLLFTFVFGVAVMNGEDMYPRMRDGDLFFYYRLKSDYQIGDVVTFSNSGTRCVGRIVAVGGDIVDLSDDGELLVNTNVPQEEIFYPTYPVNKEITFPYSVEEGNVFILDDLRSQANDSRTYGSISVKKLDGELIALLRRRGI